MSDYLQQLVRNVEERLTSSELDREVIQSALDALDEVGDDFELVVLDDAYDEFVVAELNREQARLQAETPDDIPGYVDADEPRDEPLCTCPDADCPIKEARIPPQVEREGLRPFIQDHQGYPQALVAADRGFLAKRARIRQRFRLVNAALGTNTTVEELQTAGDTDGEGEGEADGGDGGEAEDAAGEEASADA